MNASTDLFIWTDQPPTKAEHARQKLQKPFLLWFTGLSGAGKSTLASALQAQLYGLNYHSYLLDGDQVRQGLNADLGFSAQSRQENIRRLGEVCHLFVDAGLIVLCAAISPYRREREQVRALFTEYEFIEVHLSTPLATCEARDVKGLYHRARCGEITEFTGISAPYEAPLDAEITLDTSQLSIDQCCQKIQNYLASKALLTHLSATQAS